MDASVPVFGNCCLDLPADSDGVSEALVLADSEALGEADSEGDVLADSEALVDADSKGDVLGEADSDAD